MDAQVKKRRCLRWILRLFLLLAGGLLMLLAIWFAGPLYNRFVTFPRQAAAWESLRKQREPVIDETGWKEYRGILHSHSHLSHDSEVPFEHILQTLKQVDLDFICMSDHTEKGIADFSVQWRGMHDGKLFIPGFEMRDGFMPFGVSSQAVISNQMDSATLAREVVRNGGVLFFAHPEQPRQWELPELTGMEIYNIHIDFKNYDGGLLKLLPNLMLSLNHYPDHLYYEVFRPPVELLKRFDEMNRSRHFTAIGGNDCHQNVGYRGFYTTNGTILIEDTSPETLKEFKPGWFTRPLARLLWGPLEPGRKLFHVQMDPYERSARFVNTHLMLRDLTEAEVLDALRAGRAFVGFDMIADCRGFRWWAANGSRSAIMGESMDLGESVVLRAASPLPCKFVVVKDGAPVHESEGRKLDWKPTGTGKYRLEAHVQIAGKWFPWVYTNPIQLR